MMRLTFAAAALAASVCTAGAALAADVYDPGSLKDAPMPAPVEVYGWDGISIGAGVGGAFLNYDGGMAGVFDVTPPGVADAFAFPLDDDDGTIFGTVQLGYDRTLPSRFLIGVLADYDFSGGTDTSFGGTALLATGAPGDALSFAGTAEVDNSWTLGGRLGYLATPDVLLYGLVGWTHADLDVSGVFSTTVGGGVPVAFSAEESMDSLTLGAGIETMLGRGFSLKLEYRYTDLDGLAEATALTGIAGGISDGDAVTAVDTDLHTIRAVLTWRPGM
jgi:outer membrane immunogenic protein